MKYLAAIVTGALLWIAADANAQCALSEAKKKSACSAGASTCGAPVKAEQVEATINADALAAIIRSGIEVSILDARTGKYDDGRRIPGAKSLAATASDAEVAKTIGSDKGALVVTYCSSVKCPASKRLADALKKKGYTNVLEFPEGIDGWAKSGKTVVAATK